MNNTAFVLGLTFKSSKMSQVYGMYDICLNERPMHTENSTLHQFRDCKH